MRDRQKKMMGIVLTGAAAAAVMTACGGSNSDGPTTIPQLSAAKAAAFVGDCADLTAKISALSNTSITAVNKIAAGTVKVGGVDVPEHCQVTGKMNQRTGIDGASYAIGFEIRLPKNWNGRFYHQGNGGLDGAVVAALGGLGGGPLSGALFQGFAVLSSDAGHSGATPDFGIDPQARLDYGYQAVGKLTPMAKSVITSAYGKAPDRSYFGGCSNGGRHAMITASRYPNDYDGILAGAPGYNLPKAAVANLAGARLYASVATASPVATAADLATGFTDTERKFLASRVLAKCDALDGSTDGMVQDVAACQAAFSIANDVPTCAGARDGACLSAAQKTVIGKIFSGTTTSTGALIYSSFPYDGGHGGGSSVTNSGVAFWEFFAALNLDAGSTGIIFKTPPESPAGFNGPNFSLTTNIDSLVAGISATNATYTESSMSFMTPPNASNLVALQSRGAKMMVYHGVSDAIFSVNDTEAWYKGVQAIHGSGAAAGFARFFRVPGMGHCSAGPAADQFDMLTPLVNWVEKGQAPDSVVAAVRGAGNAGGANTDVPATWAANRTRPLCAYPKVARFTGTTTSSVEDAASFSCQ
jgi:Tannase and feruloyl esterase